MRAAPAFVHGYPFEAWLADRGRATPADAAALVASLATQVQAARAVGLGPGQAVPALVRIDASGAPVVDVWNAAARRKGGADDASALRGRFGPPPGELLDERSDVYVLGVVLHHLLVGRFPFAGSNPVEAALAHRHDAPLAPSTMAPGVPEVLDAVVLRCLAKDPAERFTTAGELAGKLTGKLPEAVAEPLPPSLPGAPLPTSRASAAALAAPGPAALPGATSLAPRVRSALGLVAASLAIAGASALGWWLARPAPSAPPAAASTALDSTARLPAPPPVAPAAAASPASEPSPTTRSQGEARPAAAPAPSATAAPRPAPRRERPAPIAKTPPPAAAAVAAPPAEARPDVTRLLAEGDALLRQKKYLGGSEPGALDRYRQVLALAPDASEARAKVALIRDTYLRLAHERRERGDFDAAHRYLSALERAFAGDAEIAAELLAVDADRAAASRSGHVAIEVRPWGNVFVDGRFVDQTPMPPLELAAGAHTIDVEGEHGRRRSVQVTVQGGDTQHVAIDLARNDG